VAFAKREGKVKTQLSASDDEKSYNIVIFSLFKT